MDCTANAHDSLLVAVREVPADIPETVSTKVYCAVLNLLQWDASCSSLQFASEHDRQDHTILLREICGIMTLFMSSISSAPNTNGLGLTGSEHAHQTFWYVSLFVHRLRWRYAGCSGAHTRLTQIVSKLGFKRSVTLFRALDVSVTGVS